LTQQGGKERYMSGDDSKPNELRAGADSPSPRRGLEAKTLIKGLAVLALFSPSTSELTLTEIARETDLPRATTYRLVRTLQTERFLALNPSTSRFHLGPALIPALYALRDHTHLARLLRPSLKMLAEAAGEWVDLATEVDGVVVVIDSVASSQNPFQLINAIGPMHEGLSSAHSKVLAAFKDKEELAKLLSVPQPAHTPHTITDPAALAAELAEVVRHGVAFDREEHALGVCAIGAPVRDASGKVTASVAVALPAPAFERGDYQRLAAIVKTYAAAMSAQLGPPPAETRRPSLPETKRTL
jgi:DNA-binding IclR family transcriptional regulator